MDMFSGFEIVDPYSIDYEKDPTQSCDGKSQTMKDKLQEYKSINRTKRPMQKKRKGIMKKSSIQNQQKTKEQHITGMMKKLRRNNIVHQFIKKLKSNIILSNLGAQDQQEYFSIGKMPVEQQFRKKIKEGKIFKVFQNDSFEIFTIIAKFFSILGIFYINSLMIAFDNLHFLNLFLYVLIVFTIAFFCLEMIGMMVKVNNLQVSFWKNLYYWIETQHLFWQIVIQIGLIFQLLHFPFIQMIMIILLTPQVLILMNKFKHVEHTFVLSLNFERYYELLKIILFNFCIAHILSIVLNLMALNTEEGEKSWYYQKNITQDSDWVVKYIWGYYWGTTIMLTVGFGDISAQNHIEALILVFIQTFACMIMAYNISELSKILQNISEMDQQKELKFKVFNQMSQRYNFEDNFKSDVLNHIDKSIDKKHELTHIEESLIEQLPEKIRLEVKRQVNKNVFKSADFFKNLTRKTQNLLAQKVNKIFAHPEEFILKNLDQWKILILRQGSVAITYKKGTSSNNGAIIQRFTVEQATKPQLLSLKFIRKNRIQGDLKSLDFSILNALQIQHFEDILKEHDQYMFEYYCSQRDKTQFHQFDLETKKCKICKNSNHDKISCPRLHFIPLREHIIYKKSIQCRSEYTERSQFHIERKTVKFSALRYFNSEGNAEILVKAQRKGRIGFKMTSIHSLTPAVMDNTQIGKKIDKCIDKVEQGLKILKGMTDYSGQLQIDVATNFKRYFPKNNPDNLVYLYSELVKANQILSNFEKKMNSRNIF